MIQSDEMKRRLTILCYVSWLKQQNVEEMKMKILFKTQIKNVS